MRRILQAGVAILALSVAAFAQFGGGGTPVQDDHDDSAPIETGYVVVTPSFATSSLTVIETFGLRLGTETTQVGMPAPNFTTSATIFVDVSNRLDRNLGIAIVNPNPSLANVTFTLRKSDGTLLATSTVPLATRRQLVQFLTQLLPTQTSTGFGGTTTPLTEYTGILVITSDVPVSMVGLRFRGLNFSTVLIGSGSSAGPMPLLSQGIGGAGAVVLPQFVAGGGWGTEIVISNSSTANVTVRVDLFKEDGTPLTVSLNRQRASSFTNLVVPGGGVLVLVPRDSNGDHRF